MASDTTPHGYITIRAIVSGPVDRP